MTAKTFNVGEVLSAADVNEYLSSGYWRRIGRNIIPSGSPVTTVTFSSILSTYRLFRITFSIQCSSDTPGLRINNDTGTSSYNSQRMGVGGTTVDASGVTSLSYLQLHYFSGGSTAGGEVFISKPNSNIRAVVHGHASVYHPINTPPQWLYSHSGSWNNTSTLINRLDFFVPSGNFYGVVALDGMQGV